MSAPVTSLHFSISDSGKENKTEPENRSWGLGRWKWLQIGDQGPSRKWQEGWRVRRMPTSGGSMFQAEKMAYERSQVGKAGAQGRERGHQGRNEWGQGWQRPGTQSQRAVRAKIRTKGKTKTQSSNIFPLKLFAKHKGNLGIYTPSLLGPKLCYVRINTFYLLPDQIHLASSTSCQNKAESWLRLC